VLADACVKLRKYGIEGIELDRNRIEKYVNESLMLVTALSPAIGYDKAAKVAHRALTENISLRDAALKEGVSREDFDRLVDPKKMVGNPRRDLQLG
jgi:fumarate hydratase class II